MAIASSCSSATSFLHFSFSLSLSLLFFSATSSTDTIYAESSLSGNQTINSGGGRLVLGFFTPPGSTGTTSFNYYIGIWYDTISVVTPVWVANRATPVTDPTASELKISDDGNLIFLNQFKSIIWSTNVTTIPSSNSIIVAVILDTGNLQLRDESNSSLIFWQSFDHPTDTWLPGAKIGFNKLTSMPQRLTSWKRTKLILLLDSSLSRAIQSAQPLSICFSGICRRNIGPVESGMDTSSLLSRR
ncbi:G-type lectin S-receptor-like serine/threonine-protein kinase At2g19130 [Zingiber officinale]|uniref:G-type lectin S-receptor-like serine/threonine-protein kinase At2g19130 n=1 Tax=Zingiber officinale TaxID=94328 RepID=UPI001C4B807F|nr:G-type lectin S-receptor-like serine/threonine-protein kinase At2g19130 [Zingiber officinale]